MDNRGHIDEKIVKTYKFIRIEKMVHFMQAVVLCAIAAADWVIVNWIFIKRPRTKMVFVQEQASSGWGSSDKPNWSNNYAYLRRYDSSTSQSGKARAISTSLTRNEQKWVNTKRVCYTLASLFTLDFVTLWGLSHIGGPISGGINGIVRQFGGNITIAAAGILGAFLVLLICTVWAFQFLKKAMN
jgi:hypothetical protein